MYGHKNKVSVLYAQAVGLLIWSLERSNTHLANEPRVRVEVGVEDDDVLVPAVFGSCVLVGGTFSLKILGFSNPSYST